MKFHAWKNRWGNYGYSWALELVAYRFLGPCRVVRPASSRVLACKNEHKVIIFMMCWYHASLLSHLITINQLVHRDASPKGRGKWLCITSSQRGNSAQVTVHITTIAIYKYLPKFVVLPLSLSIETAISPLNSTLITISVESFKTSTDLHLDIYLHRNTPLNIV